MKTFTLAAGVLAGSLLLAGCKPGSHQENILPYTIHQHELANGLKVVTVPFDSPGLAAFYLVVRTGSRNEVEPGVTGFAHFFEHMMFRGTDKYPNDKYNEVLKSTGASANANTSMDRTVYHMTGNAARLETMFELESDRFMNLNYSEGDFKVEAGAVKGEYTKNYASPYSQLYEATQNAAYDVHTYKHTTMGFYKDIEDMPNQFAYSKTFFDRYYRPEYTTIVVVGDVTPDNVNALAEKYFGTWKRGTHTDTIPVEPPQTGTRYVHVKNGSILPVLSMNYKVAAFDEKKVDFPSYDIISSYAFGPTSDLYRKLVLEEQKVQWIQAGAMDSRDPGLFGIMASIFKPEDMQYVRDQITATLEKIKTEGLDPEKLKKTKSYLKYSYAMGIDNPDAIANSLCHYISLTGDPEAVNRLYQQYEKTSIEDIKSVASTWFVETGLTIATISAAEQGGVK